MFRGGCKRHCFFPHAKDWKSRTHAHSHTKLFLQSDPFNGRDCNSLGTRKQQLGDLKLERLLSIAQTY